MTEIGKTYVLAFVKQAGLGTILSKGGKFLRGAGRMVGAMPFWIGGATLTSALIGKKPQVEKMYIPRQQYRQLLNAQQQEWQRQQQPSPEPAHPHMMARR